MWLLVYCQQKNPPIESINLYKIYRVSHNYMTISRGQAREVKIIRFVHIISF